MDWTDGYASDVEYVSGYYKDQSPVFLNFICALNGVEPPPLDEPYTYFELGFGRGLTCSLLAAANPAGRFYAADFNPAHVAGARRLAKSAQLDNLSLLEISFADLAAGKQADLPQFDYITLHGIYTWVTAESQRHIVDFIARYLKPGGVVYVGYNAMPGWAAALPLQRMLVEYAEAHPGRSDVQIKAGAELMLRMQSVGAAYVNNNPALATRIETLKTGSANYLVHEYMHKHWAPLYFADLARDLAGAKLDFVASTDPVLSYPEVYLTPERRALLDTAGDAIMRETLLDYLANANFRRDLFVRGVHRMSAARYVEVLSRFGLMLTVPRAQATLTMKTTRGEIVGRDTMFLPILDALAAGPHTIAELAALPALNHPPVANLAQAVALLVSSGQAHIYQVDAQSEGDAALRMNRALAAQVRYSDEHPALCAPLLGGGVQAGYLERLVYLVLSQSDGAPDAMTVARGVVEVPRARERLGLGGNLTAAQAKKPLLALAQQIETILTDVVPIWRRLGVL